MTTVDIIVVIVVCNNILKKNEDLYLRSVSYLVFDWDFTLTSAFGVRCVSMVVIKIAWNETTSEIEQKKRAYGRENKKKTVHTHKRTYLVRAQHLYESIKKNQILLVK